MSKVRRIEAGVILPIAAVLIVPLMILFLLFGLDTFRIKRADLELRAVADKVCQAAVKNLPFQNRVAQEFVGQLFAARTGDSATRLLPQLDSFYRIDATLILAATVNELTPGTDPRPTCPTSLGLAYASPTNLSCGDDCEVGVTVIDNYCDTQDSPRDLPVDFSDPWSAQGTFLGCKLEGRVRSFLPAGLYSLAGPDLSAERTASVRYAYGHRIRDFSPPSTPDSSPWPSGSDNGPAFVLAIAPQLMTADQNNALLPLMRFDWVRGAIDDPLLRGAFDALAQQYDPLRSGTVVGRYVQKQPNDIPQMALDFPENTDDGWSFETNDRVSQDLTEEFVASTPGIRERIVANCLNPVTLLRNALASTLVEMAGRSGHFRNRSEVLLVNSEAVHLNSALFANRGPTFFPPTILVPFSRDLLAPAVDGNNHFLGYQLPFTPAFWAARNSSGAEIGVPITRIGPAEEYPSPWINPLIQPSAVSGNAQRYSHRFLASQMRICNLMYYGGSNPSENPPGMTLRPLHDSSANAGITNEGFDASFEERTGPLAAPIDFESGIGPSISISRPVSLRKGNSGYTPPQPNNERWEQECPWQALQDVFPKNDSSSCPAPSPGRTRGLTASELVASLGTIQSCPINGLAMESGTCSYGSLATTNFPLASPDVAGLQRYLNGQISAIKSPGIFPFKKSESPNPRVFGLPPDVLTGNVEVSEIYPSDALQARSYAVRKSLVLILHRPPATSACTSGDWATGYRSVTVVYIPAPSPAESPEPTSPAAVNQVRSCFGLDAATNPYFSEDGKVMLLVLSPNEPRYDPDARDDDYASLPDFSEMDEEERFATYWAYLLTGEPVSIGGSPKSSESIIDVAAAIYNQRLVETVPHL